MALTLAEIYDHNQTLNAVTLIEFKRKLVGAGYEADWNDVETLVNHPVIIDSVLGSIKNKLPNDSYSFGVLEVPSCVLSFNSLWGEFEKEQDSRSIFYGYVRHMTQVKISYGYHDTKSGDTALVEEYRGFINDESQGTRVDESNIVQFLQIEDMLTMLVKKYTFADIAPTQVNLNDLIYEIFNRSEFTDFLTVDSGNIDAGYNVQNINYTNPVTSDPSWFGNTQIIEMIQDLSTGHSMLFQKQGVLYYQPLAPTGAVVKIFQSDKILKYMNYERGIDKVFDKIYWTGTNTSWDDGVLKYNKTLEIEISGIYLYAQRLAYLTAVGGRVSKEYDGFVIEVPLYPEIFILDKIQVIGGSYDPPDAFILDKSRLDIDYLRNYLGANQSNNANFWMVKEVEHNHQSMTTRIIVSSFL
jgi:hypothetical protein